jgi:hypothetical protein
MIQVLLSRRLALALMVCLLPAGCKHREKKIRVQQTDEDSAALASVIHMADPKAAPQLMNGFYSVEQGTWRWTMGKFALALRPPRGAAVKGATLHLRFTIVAASIERLKTISLSATVNSTPLSPETYTQPGAYDYSREVDARLLAGDSVNVEFALDKFLPAGAIETRELGVIVTSAGLEAK